MAGVPSINSGLYRTIRFLVGDPVVWIESKSSDGHEDLLLILRDIEMDRAKANSRATRVACPADFTPSGGLSGDRETATAQAAAECLKRAGHKRVIVDRSLPMIFAEMLQRAGIGIECDTEWGVIERRQKDAREIKAIQYAQQVTEDVMRRACETVARCQVDSQGCLVNESVNLTSEALKSLIDIWLLERGFQSPGSIVAGGRIGADCHDHGHGPLKTGEPVIIDIYPRDKATLYNGDCTRTVVHGQIPKDVAAMHAAVCRAKAAATAAVRAGVTGHAVHEATIASILGSGYQMGLPPADAPDSYSAMTHGTGHGLGLDVHEPPLLAQGGPTLLVGDVVTIEPGLYCKAIGGVRVEDMVVVTETGCDNLNVLPEGLNWD